MKVKKIRIKIMDQDRWFNHVESILKNAEKGHYKYYPPTVSFTNIEVARKVLSPRRIELLSTIRHQKPASMYELAKMVNRDRKSVTSDVKLLKQIGFVTLKKHQKARTIVTPQVPFEEINLQMRI